MILPIIVALFGAVAAQPAPYPTPLSVCKSASRSWLLNLPFKVQSVWGCVPQDVANGDCRRGGWAPARARAPGHAGTCAGHPGRFSFISHWHNNVHPPGLQPRRSRQRSHARLLPLSPRLFCSWAHWTRRLGPAPTKATRWPWSPARRPPSLVQP
jgi:hypothetical protein